MNKKYFIRFIYYSLFMIFAPMAVFAATFSRNLTVGSSGSDVEALQNFLTEQGAYAGPVTGYFGNLTREGVKKFQTKNGIFPVSGYFGPLTRLAANKNGSSSSVVAPAPDNHTRVADLQKQLQNLLSQLASLQAPVSVIAPPATIPPAISTTTSAVIATSTPASVPPAVSQILPNPFVSPMIIVSDYPSRTLSGYTGATLNEFRLSSVPEKVAITRFRLTNSGTFSETYFNSISIVNGFTGEVLATMNGPVNGVADFVFSPDPAKTNKGLMVSGGTYAVMGDLRTPNYGGTKPFIQLDINSVSDVVAVDYDTLTRIANLSAANAFPVSGPQITAF